MHTMTQYGIKNKTKLDSPTIVCLLPSNHKKYAYIISICNNFLIGTICPFSKENYVDTKTFQFHPFQTIDIYWIYWPCDTTI